MVNPIDTLFFETRDPNQLSRLIKNPRADVIYLFEESFRRGRDDLFCAIAPGIECPDIITHYFLVSCIKRRMCCVRVLFEKCSPFIIVSTKFDNVYELLLDKYREDRHETTYEIIQIMNKLIDESD